MEGGGMANERSVVTTVANKDALAQAFEMVCNGPRNPRVFHALRDIVDMTSDAQRLSFTSVGDLKLHGRSTLVDHHILNDGLRAYAPTNMTKCKQVGETISRARRI